MREKILSAARELFIREGVEATTMRRIADAIEYTPPVIYCHFKDKEDLVRALCEQDFALFRAALDGAYHLSDPVERLREMGRAYVRFALEHPHHYRLMFMTPRPAFSEEELPEEHGNPDYDAYECLRRAVRACIEAGRFAERYRDPEAVTQACWGAAHGVVSLYIVLGADPWVNFRPAAHTAELLMDAQIDGMLRGEGGR